MGWSEHVLRVSNYRLPRQAMSFGAGVGRENAKDQENRTMSTNVEYLVGVDVIIKINGYGLWMKWPKIVCTGKLIFSIFSQFLNSSELLFYFYFTDLYFLFESNLRCLIHSITADTVATTNTLGFRLKTSLCAINVWQPVQMYVGTDSTSSLTDWPLKIAEGVLVEIPTGNILSGEPTIVVNEFPK